jgi:hypothetical protein
MTQSQTRLQRIQIAIAQGKYYHVFLYGQYFRSFIHKEAAECYSCVVKDSLIYLGPQLPVDTNWKG